ncbi:chemotaxis protein CheD [Natranaeroarchaeum aerophilus]|uniref:Probable chemoreceptor glutamine deamidase CheD n=1 Tax=Natranaeroarchaeum aerophilus TaxID=2917711 RepID=A0AAE3FTN3_9EURY|nr:chemotaxis protein CheD [Natranaeroarchaeum aerophilus]MCL9815124.1 chemotaxis protein CheD [Natranaeroarchaeum aerophilus]
MKTYGSEPGAPESDPVRVGISEFEISDSGQCLKSFGLGSCVAVALYDDQSQVGGLAHVMLPNGDENDDMSERKPGKFADTAIRAMLRQMVETGASYTDVEAKLAGGGDMFEFESFGDGVGHRNVVAAREELDKLGVPITAEEVGGQEGRTVEFDTGTGVLSIRTADGEGTVEEL